MIKKICLSLLFISLMTLFPLALIMVANSTTIGKDYDKGYTKGYTDAVLVYAQENAKRDSISAVRHSQFIQQMQRLTIAINNYHKATKHIQGINYEW